MNRIALAVWDCRVLSARCSVKEIAALGLSNQEYESASLIAATRILKNAVALDAAESFFKVPPLRKRLSYLFRWNLRDKYEEKLNTAIKEVMKK